MRRFTVTGAYGWVVGDLFGDIAETLFRTDVLKGLTQEWIKGLRGTSISAGIGTGSKGGYELDTKLWIWFSPGLVKELTVLHLLTETLQHR
jgi:hypothetical protein